MKPIYMGCLAGIGQGGLGSHLQFISRAAVMRGSRAHVYCRGGQEEGAQTQFVPDPAWFRFTPYTPLRWMTGSQVYLESVYFDRRVCRLLPRTPMIYHGFPGYAEASFREIRRRGGVTVLEAATTHALELFQATEREHEAFNMKGSPYSRPWLDRVLREYELADYISVASALQYESFVRHGIPRSKLLYAPLGVNVSRFRPEPGQQSLRPREKNEPFRVIQVGQISLRKGFVYLLEAAARLQDPKLEIMLFGGIGWRAIRGLIESYSRRGVRITAASGDPLPALRSAHLCIHPSVEDGFGLAPLEAMAAGLPAVVTEQTGMKEAIADGTSGFIIPARDPDAIARCIKLLKADDARRVSMAEAAREAALGYDAALRMKGYARELEPIWGSA
ncbi:glycosyltransferase family 4 protein [Paenibacillus sp. y28]|uniref:glycosyltransferase family 4 protein n=1 Tax=Paenibacillus sp. y28 TaxID=3129110 RepID=UPI003015A832